VEGCDDAAWFSSKMKGHSTSSLYDRSMQENMMSVVVE
jgi:hypothetical protein